MATKKAPGKERRIRSYDERPAVCGGKVICAKDLQLGDIMHCDADRDRGVDQILWMEVVYIVPCGDGGVFIVGRRDDAAFRDPDDEHVTPLFDGAAQVFLRGPDAGSM